jgi:TetR/AcrR family transcriptional repressor of nem operon
VIVIYNLKIAKEIAMARSQAEKALTHERIVSVAARRFRELGLNGIGVADVMKEAGLTGGGFYKHFESREKLVEEAIGFAMSEKGKEAEQRRLAGPVATSELVDRYLSEKHRDHPGAGCAVGALVNDASRAGEGLRSSYTEEVRKMIASLEESLADTRQSEQARTEAVMAMCTLVGALGLARAVSDADLSREILAAGKTLLQTIGAK